MRSIEGITKKTEGWLLCILGVFLKGMLGFLLCLVFAQAHALTRKTVIDEGDLNIRISRQDLTRIAVCHDRILRVHRLEGIVELKSEPEEGIIFIRPLGFEETSPANLAGAESESVPTSFTLFITTEKHRHVTLHVTPTTQLGDSVLIVFRSKQRAPFLHAARYRGKGVMPDLSEQRHHHRFFPCHQHLGLANHVNHFTAQDNTPW